MADRVTSWDEPHDEAEALLPWYATGRLDEEDRARVEKHLSGCAECRAQLGIERRFISEFRTYTPEVESGWSRIRSRVVAGAAVPSAPQRSAAQVGAELWAAFTRPVVVALATAQVAFLAVASGLLLWLSQPAYEALGSAPPPATANAMVMFAATATDQDIRIAMKTAGARIVDGPTSTGAYLLHLDTQQRQSALARLRSDGQVRLAEPIDAGPAS